MKYERYLHHASMLLILTGFYAISITGSEYLWAVVAGMLVTGLYWVFGERIPNFLRVPRWIWNVFAILLVLYFLHDTFLGKQDLVGNGIQFVIYLQIVKLLSPKTNRDWMQIYVLSFMHVLASTVLTSDIAFAFPFLVYVVLATWTLAMFNLKTQLEEATAPERRRGALHSLLSSRDVITRRFLAATSALSLSIIAVTLIVFFLFPRVSMGNFLKRITTRDRVSGFSEEVELGTIGTIKTNDRIVMRVEVNRQDLSNLEMDRLHWRGTAADIFDGRVWRKSEEGKGTVRIDMESGVLALERATYPGGKAFRYRVFLEALNPPILFAADRVEKFIWDKPLVERLFRRGMGLQYDMYGGLYFPATSNLASDLTYEAESVVGEPDPSLLAAKPGRYPTMVEDYFLELPKLTPKVRQLMSSIPVPKGSVYERTSAITRYIEQNYRYTLDVQDVGATDPLEFFLVDRKEGHCEYFSTALAMVLRFHGIPSRHVVGFRGGEFNEFGSYVAVRQLDAHSWVEVYFPKYGWLAFDPSPLDGSLRGRKPRFVKLYQFVDNLRLRWNKYIVEYDLRAQSLVAERVGHQVLRFLRSNERRKPKDGDSGGWLSGLSLKGAKEWISYVLLAAMALLFGVYLVQRLRVSRRAFGRFAPALHFLASRGYPKAFSETAEELAARIEAKEGDLPPLRELIAFYYDERFGGVEHPDEAWQRAFTELRGLLAYRRHERKRAA